MNFLLNKESHYVALLVGWDNAIVLRKELMLKNYNMVTLKNATLGEWPKPKRTQFTRAL